jgi:hypothetical protein
MTPSESATHLIDTARDLAQRFPGVPPPLRAMAHEVGIGRIERRADLPVSGLLIEHPPRSYAAIIRSSDPPERQRFSLAHEIAHVIMASVDAVSDLSCREASVERMCDRLAAELIMPAELLQSCGSLAQVLELGHACSASPATAALRLADLDPTVAVVAWATRDRPGSTTKLRAVWSRSPPGVYLPTFVTPPQDMRLPELAVGDSAVTRARLNMGSLRGTFRVESQRIRPTGSNEVEVLSVVTCSSAGGEERSHAS